VFSLVIAGVLGYLLGSVPTAYLLVRWKSKIDIRDAGSGNVGTLNSYVVTRSKLVGAAVLVLDILKGLLVIFIIRAISDSSFASQAVAGVAVVVGHSFPVWLKFKGGRGLATAAGVMLALGWIVVLIWCIWWFLGFKLSKAVNVGNGVACVLTLVLVVVSPTATLARFIPAESSTGEFRAFIIVLLSVLLLRHVEPLREFMKKRKINEG
jgi:glycerol-3-phosphate acyltransferase PlsY